MSEKVTVDFFTRDPNNNEFVMYLVEEGPWHEDGRADRLTNLQKRLYNAVDVAIDGQLASRFPESKSMQVRIQVDFHGDPPESLEEFVKRFAENISRSEEYRLAIKESQFISDLRIVTGTEMGRNFRLINGSPIKGSDQS
jgi:hypothetical protein